MAWRRSHMSHGFPRQQTRIAGTSHLLPFIVQSEFALADA